MKSKNIQGYCLIAFFALLFNYSFVFSKETKGLSKSNTSSKFYKSSASCSPPSSAIELDINNVRARLLNGGDLWVNGSLPAYQIPKVDASQISKCVVFAGAIWLGGIDDAGILRTAGQTYRQRGIDYWPGSIDTTSLSATITSEDCALYDKHYKVNNSEIALFRQNGGSVPSSIANWPGNPIKPYQSKSQAPFIDFDANGVYNPVSAQANNSDYPNIIGDQAIWWVFNDVGNAHTAYSGQPIGMEIQVLAFAFNTTNEINDMTFYRYRLINRGSNTLLNAYMAQWADPDLGNGADDYVGVDVGRSFGYCINGDDDDETDSGYGLNPPGVGIDFFEGPFSDFKDGVDNDRDGVIDEVDSLPNGTIQTERIALSKFFYFNNETSGPKIDPVTDVELYNYLTGKWKDGTTLTYGGDGYDQASTDFADFSFPRDTDPQGRAFWSECSENNIPNDRRFLESAGPFTLIPGAVNSITVGVVFANNNSKSASCPDGVIPELLLADDKAQALFDNNFQLADGPPTPSLRIVELDRKLIINIENASLTEKYDKIELDAGLVKNRYKFQGYQLYQTISEDISITEIDVKSKAALIYQGDLEDNVGTIINKTFDPILQNLQASIKVIGSNNGISHSIEVTKDAFNSNNKISNNKQYYFLLVAYAYSDSAKSVIPGKEYGDQYLSGRKNINIYTGIPRLPNPRFGGSNVSDAFSGVELKRLSGSGNGFNFVNFLNNDPSVAIPGNISLNPVYNVNEGPVKIKVYDPFKVPNADFELKFGMKINGVFVSGLNNWILINKSNNDTIFSDTSYVNYEQLIPEYGLSINVINSPAPGINPDFRNNGLIGASLVFADETKKWLSFVPDVNGLNAPTNWIDQLGGAAVQFDPNSAYSTILGGIIAPYRISSTLFTKFQVTPAFEFAFQDLPSIDIIFTPDVSKWSKCIVVETSSVPSSNEGAQARLNLRKGLSLVLNGSSLENVTDGSQGLSYFPGYAVNTSTGERLNIFFGESSSDEINNGRDMKFNPTSSEEALGGKHYLYVTNTKYDECSSLYTLLNPVNLPSNTNKRNAYKTVAWTSIPLGTRKAILSTDVKLSIRVSNPFAIQNTGIEGNSNFPFYSFNTGKIASVSNNLEIAKSALDLIRIVPNPYYGFSEYEIIKTDNRVKFTNLPAKCSITIYTSGGNFVRRLEKDDIQRTFIDWNLTNFTNIPVASGMYIVHVKADGIGEKVLKWFGVARPADLDNF